MPRKNIDLTDAEDALLGAEAAKNGTTIADLLRSQATRQVHHLELRKVSSWFDALPLADKQRLYDAEHA